MALNLVSIKCPECGAVLNIEDGRKMTYCAYCGTKIMLDNTNEYIYRNIDEAKIKQAEVDKEINIKKMEIYEKQRAAKEASKKTKIKLTVILVIITIISFLVGFASSGKYIGAAMVGMVCCYILMFMWLNDNNKEDDEIDFGDRIKMPSAISNYEEKNYVAVEEVIKSAGFTNVKSVPLNDLSFGLFTKPGTVEAITVNGTNVTSGGKKYSKDAAIVITYHSHRV